MRNQGAVIDQEDDLLRSNFLPVMNSESIHDPTITLSGSSTLSMLTSGIVCTYCTLLYILTLKSFLNINNNNNNNNNNSNNKIFLFIVGISNVWSYSPNVGKYHNCIVIIFNCIVII